VVLREGVEHLALLRAYVHGLVLRHLLLLPSTITNLSTSSSVEVRSVEWMREHYAQWLLAVTQKGWHTDTIVLAPRAPRASWTSTPSSKSQEKTSTQSPTFPHPHSTTPSQPSSTQNNSSSSEMTQ